MIRSVRRRPRIAVAGLVALTLSACSGVSVTPLPSGAAPPADCVRVDADGVIAVSADNLEFGAPCMVATAGEAFTILFTNNESQPHDVAVYRDDTKANEILRGEAITGPDQSLDYSVEALDAGQYYFDCTIHPGDMNGALYVVAADA